MDGITGEAYKSLGEWILKPVMEILRKMQAGDPLPTDWLTGAVAQIYKNKGDAKECRNYRPILLEKIIYKITLVKIHFAQFGFR